MSVRAACLSKPHGRHADRGVRVQPPRLSRRRLLRPARRAPLLHFALPRHRHPGHDRRLLPLVGLVIRVGLLALAQRVDPPLNLRLDLRSHVVVWLHGEVIEVRTRHRRLPLGTTPPS